MKPEKKFKLALIASLLLHLLILWVMATDPLERLREAIGEHIDVQEKSRLRESEKLKQEEAAKKKASQVPVDVYLHQVKKSKIKQPKPKQKLKPKKKKPVSKEPIDISKLDLQRQAIRPPQNLFQRLKSIVKGKKQAKKQAKSKHCKPKRTPAQRKAQKRYGQWMKIISSLAEGRAQYPEAELNGKQGGKVQVGFTVNKGGYVSQVVILRSSGNTSVDVAAIKTVRALSPITMSGPFTRSGSRKMKMDLTFAPFAAKKIRASWPRSKSRGPVLPECT